LKILLILSIILSLYSLSFILFGNNFTILAQKDVETIKYRDLVIYLGNGLKTNAQLTIPAVGDGPFPGVLLIHGSGTTDMNVTLGFIRIDNETGKKIYPSARPFLQIAEYLSERGFVVLRYDKRGIGENFTILDRKVWGNITFDNLKQDAEKALNVLIQQPKVDANRITVLGHSEGTVIVPRVAIDNPTKVKNIIVMGTVAQNLIRDVLHFQVIDLPLEYSTKLLDQNHTGMISIQQIAKDPLLGSYLESTFLHTNNSKTVIKNQG
jgi:pimeloyl-ACP methyl ester carboxylesterase